MGGVSTHAEDVFPITMLPDEILEEVLSKLCGKILLLNASRVCKQWNELIGRQSLWKKKCHIENLALGGVEDYKLVYFLSPYRRNLIKNPYANEGFTHWQITWNGGNKFKIEEAFNGHSPGIKNPASLNLSEETLEGVHNWVTSYAECRKEQLIDLLQEGFRKIWLDEMEASIYVEEWYAARFDCGSKYTLKVQLLDDKQESMDNFEITKTEPDWGSAAWKKVSYEFPRKCREGLRFIRFIHTGCDTKFWSGHYGSKFTGATVKFRFGLNI